jgi:hypothetical protein
MRDGAGYVYPAAAAYARKYSHHQWITTKLKPLEQVHYVKLGQSYIRGFYNSNHRQPSRAPFVRHG